MELPTVSYPEVDIEAPGTQTLVTAISSVSMGNLTRLVEQVDELKSNVQDLQKAQREVQENKKGIIAQLKDIAIKIGAEISSCFSCSSTHERGEPSYPPTCLPSPNPPASQPKVSRSIQPTVYLSIQPDSSVAPRSLAIQVYKRKDVT